MKIWHRGHVEVEHKDFLDANNIRHEPVFSVKFPDKLQDYRYDIYEDHPAWPELKQRIGPNYIRHWLGTEYTDEERLAAERCIIRGIHSIEALDADGYGWHREYYADQCHACGTGWRQIKSFRLKREPKLGKNQFSSFGSAFELFCTPLVVDEFSRLGVRGFETQPLLLESRKQVEALRQVIVKATAEPGVAEDFVERERYEQADCPVCGRTWHSFYVRGMLPLRRSALRTDVDFQLTNEWFGSGRNARHEILVSQRVVRLILEKKWRGSSLVPIKAV